MTGTTAIRVLLATTLALAGISAPLSAPAWAGEVPAVDRSLASVETSVQSLEAAQRALATARAHHDELAHRITALKRLRRGEASAPLTELLERSVAAEKDLSARTAARDAAKAEVERRVGSAVQLIDEHIRGLRPRLKSTEGAERTTVALRLKSLLADREAARAALGRVGSERSTPQAWAQYEVKVEALDGPADLREKADFVEDTRDKLKKKRQALERMVADARQAREIARAAVNFRTEVGLFDEQTRTGRVAKSESAQLAGARSGGDATLAETAPQGPNKAATDPETPTVGLVAPPAPATDGPTDRTNEFSNIDDGSGGTTAPAPAPVAPAPSAVPLPRSVDPAAVLNLDVRALGAGKDMASMEAMLAELVKLDQMLGAQASQIRRRAQALEADEARALGQ